MEEEKKTVCDQGYNGMCCCNCKNQIKIHRHCTFDMTDEDKGCICSQPFKVNGKEAYLCTGGGEVRASIMSKHGMCELHVFNHPKH